MTVKQLSVFVENRQGRLGEVLAVLKDNGVSILSMSLADTTEYGLLRIIVNQPERGCEVLVAAGFSAMLTDVIIVKVPHVAGALQSILEKITEKILAEAGAEAARILAEAEAESRARLASYEARAKALREAAEAEALRRLSIQ